MAIGVIRNNSIFGIEEEVTEGTYVVPSAATSYMQCLDGFDMKFAREIVDRNLVTSSPGKETPRMGTKSVSGQMPTEFRASGTEGADVDFTSLLKSALGARRQNTSRVTAKNTAHSSTVIYIEDADISKFAVGDIVMVLESGEYECRPISAINSGVGTASITFPFALTGGAPANTVQLSKFTTYYTASTGHPSLSISHYLGDAIRKAALGCKVTSMALENFQSGKVASLNFGFEGMNFTEIDGSAPHTPTYDSGLPPIILNACVWRDGVLTQINALSLNLANELGWITSTCSANGRTNSRLKSREITGSINPYKDDASVDYFDDWVAGTEFSLFMFAGTPSSTAGQFTLGSVVGIWLPQCFATEYANEDADGVVTDALSFRATRGSAGTSEEMYMSFI